jgi:hypothetical protein
MRPPPIALLTSSLLALGCSSGPGSAEVSEQRADLTHTFPAYTVSAGDEITGLCMSWTLGNEQPLFVNAVRAKNDGAWHHSNWAWVADTQFAGPDGPWPCAERNYEQITAAAGGGMFFAQSTQALEEEQRFAEGVAIRLPPHVRVIGDVHLLNTGAADKPTSLTFEVDLIEQSAVQVELNPMSITNIALSIPPEQQSLHEMDCSFSTGPADFSLYYVLPHYHALGNLLSLHAVGGARDGEVLFQSNADLGEAWGKTLDPPLSMGGATGVRVTCGYDNPRVESVGYGVGDQEMCVFLAFTDSTNKFGGFSLAAASVGERTTDGIWLNRYQCTLLGAPSAQP